MREKRFLVFLILSAFLTFCLTASAWAAMSNDDFVQLCSKGTIQEIRTALLNGANSNAKDSEQGRTALLAASENENLKILSLLLKVGADVNAKDNNGVTALMVATLNNTEAVSLLLEAGADVNAKTDWGMTALMVAASLNKTPEVIDLLLKHGADINEKSNSGGTALMYAALNNPNPGILSFLINAGADIDAKDDYGLTALDIARRDANKSVQTVLEGAAPILK